ncbi:hypothetical protein BSKO_05657 [Bryopsis sp. KO-2023]|nr:hypothetical protein BSKO_05657 [Bryopsis sp. KO-2023]
MANSRGARSILLQDQAVECDRCHVKLRGRETSTVRVLTMNGMRLGTNRVKRRFTRIGGDDLVLAFKWYKLVQLRCGANVPNQRRLRYRKGTHVDEIVKEEVQWFRTGGLPHRRHACDTLGCDGIDPDHGEVFDMVVVDGVETFYGRRCAVHHCTNDPTTRTARFCTQHQYLEHQCAACLNHRTRTFCTNVVVAGSQCCALHARVERDYGGELSRKRIRPRRLGESQTAWRSSYLQWYRIRRTHRFAASRIHGFYVAMRVCGTVIGVAPMFTLESPEEMTSWLDNQIFMPNVGQALPRPTYLVYDRACQVLRCFFAGNSLAHLAARWLMGSTRWIVDRFHYFGHSRSDNVCAAYCSPMRMENKGMVRVLHRRQVNGGGDPDLQTDFGRRLPAWVAPNGTTFRSVRLLRRIDGGGQWFEFVVLDILNTQVCEQFFSQLNSYSRMIRPMSSFFAEFFMNHITLMHNEQIQQELRRKGMNPNQPDMTMILVELEMPRDVFPLSR